MKVNNIKSWVSRNEEELDLEFQKLVYVVYDTCVMRTRYSR